MARARAAAVSLLIFLLIAAKASWAHHPSVGFGAGTAGPVTTIPAMPLPGKQWAIGLRGDYLKFDAFSDAELERLAAAGKEVHSIDDQRSLFFSSAYGLSDDLTLGFHIPYIVRRGIREGHLDATGTPEVHVHGNSEGIGDLSLVGQYRFLRTENAGADVALLFGLKTPTGSTGETDNDGDRFDAEFQPGSGSWDPLVGLAAGRRWDSASLDASILYTLATRGTQETNLGDILHFGAAVSYRFAPARHRSHARSTSHGHGPGVSHSHLEWDFILEATGERKQKQTVLGVKDGDSGGTLVLLSPGVRLNVYERWSAYLSAGIPVLQDLNGTQHETRYRVILGISIGL